MPEIPMIEIPSNWGGNRENAGANKKPEEEKKKQLYIMVKNGTISKLGGADKVKKIMLDAIDAKLNAQV